MPSNFPGATSAPPKTVKYKFFNGHAIPLWRGDQLPGEGNSVLLEIIAKRKIAQHLKKSVMAVREAYILKVIMLTAGPHALLRSRGAL